MIKISDTLRKIIAENHFLEFGFSHRLFNLSALAKFIRPILEIRTQKEIRPSAIVMNLSRLQRQKYKTVPQIQNFQVDRIYVFSNLATLTFQKTPEIHGKINRIYKRISPNGYFAFSESNKEITIVFENKFLSESRKYLGEREKYRNENISAVGVEFSEKLFYTPGLLSLMMQKLTLQGINLIEISSTFTEFIFYIEEKDLKPAFETLHHCFVRKKNLDFA